MVRCEVMTAGLLDGLLRSAVVEMPPGDSLQVVELLDPTTARVNQGRFVLVVHQRRTRRDTTPRCGGALRFGPVDILLSRRPA